MLLTDQDSFGYFLLAQTALIFHADWHRARVALVSYSYTG